MRGVFACIGLVFFVLGCQNVQKPDPPTVKLSETKMIALLSDMALLRAGHNYNKKLMENKRIVPSEYIYDKHDVDSLVFWENHHWYSSRPKAYQQLFAKVHLVMKATLDSLEKQERIEDSIKMAALVEKEDLQKQPD